ncbi:MAG TPA: hypothetical protein VJT31_17660, partial [Rugosimonospora sp.]|nr:hypothetical protein [Rugosimonospora sp.]
MAALVIESLFALVFAHAAVAYLRRRDDLQRAVMLMFGAMAALFALDLLRRLVGPPPDVELDLAVLLIFAQPYLTLRLVALLRPLPEWLSWVAAMLYLSAVAPLSLLARPVPQAVSLWGLGCYIGTETLAAGLLVVETRRRSGPARARLVHATLATGLMAAALTPSIVSTLYRPFSADASVVTRAVALVAAGAYVLAFVPPRTLRRFWSGRAAYTVSRDLLYVSGEESPARTWQRYASTVRHVAAADAVAVLAVSPEGDVVELASDGLAAGEPAECGEADLRALLDAAQPVRVDARVRQAAALPRLAVR